MTWRRHPSEDGSPVAAPGDPDLTMELVGVRLYQPVVLDREIHVEYEADGGWVRGDDGEPFVCDEPFSGALTFAIFYTSASEGQFVWIVEQLEKWADADTPLRLYCAAGRRSTLYDPEGRYVVIPEING